MPVTGETSVEQIDQSSDETLLVLEPLQRQMQNQRLLLKPGHYTIGSADGCSLKLTAPGVGPKHCIITAEKSRVILKALDHRTWIDDGPVQQSLLRPGDRLTIGPIEFEIHRIPFHSKGPQGDLQSANDKIEESHADDDSHGDLSQSVRTEQSENITHDAGTARPFEKQTSRHHPEDTAIPPGFKRDESPSDPTIEHETVLPAPRALDEFDTSLDQRIEQRMDELARQQQLLAESLEQHQKTQSSELTVGVHESSETLLRDKREISAKQRFRDQVSRLENDLSIERALVRANQKVIARRESELQSRETVISKRMEELRANEAKHLENVEDRLKQSNTRQAELERTNVDLKSRTSDLDDREIALNRRTEEMDRRSAELFDQEPLNQNHVSNEVQTEAQESDVQHQFQEQEILLRRREAELSDQSSEVEAKRLVVEAQQEELQQSRKALAEERRDRLDQLEEAERDIQRTQEQLESEDKKQRENRQKTFDEQQARINSDRDELDAQRRLLEESQEEFTTGREKIEQLDADREEFERQQFTLKNDHEALVTHLAERDEAQNHLDDQRKQLASDLAQHEANCRQLQSDREEIDRQREELNQNLELPPEWQTELEDARRELDDERLDLKIKREQIESDRLKLADEQRKVESLRTEDHQLAEDREALAHQLEILSNDRQSFQSQEADLDESQRQLNEDRKLLQTQRDAFETQMTEFALNREQVVEQNEDARETRYDPIREREECESPEDNNRQSDSDEPESVAAYMERLLGRPSGEYSQGTSAHSTETNSTETGVGQSESDQLETDADSVLPSPDKPSRRQGKQDKEALRADLDSLRKVANRSARSAIAKHSWRKVRGGMVFKAVLTVIAVITAAVLFSGELWGTTSYTSLGWLAGAVGAISALELLRTTWSVYRRVGAARGTKEDGTSDAICDEEKADTAGDVVVHEEDNTSSETDSAQNNAGFSLNDAEPVDLPEPATQESPASNGPQHTETETPPTATETVEDVPLEGLFGASELIVTESGVSIRSEMKSDHHQSASGDSTGDVFDVDTDGHQKRESHPDPIAETFGMLDSFLDEVELAPEINQPDASEDRPPWEESDEFDF